MKKSILINGKRATIDLPKSILPSEVPNELWTIKKKTVNVGIREDQQIEIKNIIIEKKLDLSINKVVQWAVDKFLNEDVNVLTDESGGKKC